MTPRGMNNLGFAYANGKGVAQDAAQAVLWFRKSAEAGNAVGMDNLGVMYEVGRGGLQRDLDQAVSWYRKAAALGSEEGNANLKRLGR